MGLCGFYLKEMWSLQTVLIHEGKNWRQIRISGSGERQKICRIIAFSEDQRNYSLLRRIWRIVLSIERIPSKLGQDWWNETLTRGMNLKNLSLLYYSFGGDLRSVVYVSYCSTKRLSPCLFPSRAPVFSRAHYFQAPPTQASHVWQQATQSVWTWHDYPWKSCTAVIHDMIICDLECPWHDYRIICS